MKSATQPGLLAAQKPGVSTASIILNVLGRLSANLCKEKVRKSLTVFIYLNKSGCSLVQGVASWYCLAASSNAASLYNLPINVMLTGKWFLLKPVGKQRAGWPVKLVMAD